MRFFLPEEDSYRLPPSQEKDGLVLCTTYNSFPSLPALCVKRPPSLPIMHFVSDWEKPRWVWGSINLENLKNEQWQSACWGAGGQKIFDSSG